MAPAGCCGSRRRASSRERSRRIGPGGGWRPAVNGPGRLLRGLAGRMRSRCVPCTGACAPSPMPRLLRPVPAFPVFCCPRPVARVPCSAFCVLRSASCVLHPVPPCPCPRARAPVPVPPCPCPRPRPRVPRFASCAPRPTPASSVFRTRAPHPAPRTPRPCPCPCPWLRLLRPADGCPCSAPCLPPPHFGAGPSGFCKPQG